MSKNLLTRIIVAAFGIPALLLLAFIGGYLLFAFCLLVAVLGSWELSAMLLSKRIEVPKRYLTVLAILVVCMFQFFPFDRMGLLVVFVLFALAAISVILQQGVTDYPLRLGLALLLVIYPGFLVSFSIPLHREFAPVGGVLLAFTFVNTWLADTFAYGFGVWLGKRKLAPNISPGKTWAGLWFAFPGGFIAALLIHPFLEGWSVFSLLILSLVATIFGQMGDLVESAVKRDCGVKDSSSIIPGHGGVLDRFDSFVTALPAVYFTARVMS